MENPIVSVVTVVYNGVEHIEATILSVLNQSYSKIQYVIIDGGSTDNSMEIISRYSSDIDVIISEPDKGIYDAMNKAIQLCTGKWVNFMNVGDVFYSQTTLGDVFLSENYENVAVIYGNHEVSYGESKIMKYPNSLNMLWKGMTIQHQSIFVLNTFLQARPFDLQYKFAADFDIIYDLHKKNLSIKHIDIPISTVSANGFSESNSLGTYKEFWSIAKKYEKNSFFIGIYYRFVIFKRLIISSIKRLFPSLVKARILRIGSKR